MEKHIAYYAALDEVNTAKDFRNFISLVQAEVEDFLDLYLQAIK